MSKIENLRAAVASWKAHPIKARDLELLLDIVESAEAVSDFLQGTKIEWEDDWVAADHANIVIGLRAALEKFRG